MLGALHEALKDVPVNLVPVVTEEQAVAAASAASARMAILDSGMGDVLEAGARLQKANPHVGLLFVVGESETTLALEAAALGAYDFITRPIDALKTEVRVRVALDKHARTLEDRAYTVALEDRVNQRTEEIVLNRERVRTQFVNAVHALQRAIREKRPQRNEHPRRVALTAVEIARARGARREELKHIELAALFHDLGTIGVKDHVFAKSGKLTDSELAQIRIHPLVAEQILSPIEEFAPILSIVRHEHERWDGGGYPDGLQGDQIPLGARAIAIADAWDAMLSGRPHRPAIAAEEALAELERNAGTQFDPGCVELFCRAERARLQPQRP